MRLIDTVAEGIRDFYWIWHLHPVRNHPE